MLLWRYDLGFKVIPTVVWPFLGAASCNCSYSYGCFLEYVSAVVQGSVGLLQVSSGFLFSGFLIFSHWHVNT